VIPANHFFNSFMSAATECSNASGYEQQVGLQPHSPEQLRKITMNARADALIRGRYIPCNANFAEFVCRSPFGGLGVSTVPFCDAHLDGLLTTPSRMLRARHASSRSAEASRSIPGFKIQTSFSSLLDSVRQKMRRSATRLANRAQSVAAQVLQVLPMHASRTNARNLETTDAASALAGFAASHTFGKWGPFVEGGGSCELQPDHVTITTGAEYGGSPPILRSAEIASRASSRSKIELEGASSPSKDE